MIDRAALVELERKYETLVALKSAREAAIARGEERFRPEIAAERRRTMQALARAMPGSLRELDHATSDELRERLRAVRRALEFGVVEPWMVAASLFHRRLRELLHARRHGERARPKAGRLVDEVWREIGRELGVDAGEAERLLHPRARPREG